MIQRLRQIVTHNLGIKISALILALAVYAHVFSKEDREEVFQVPIVVQGLPEVLTYQGEVPEKVRVRIRARGTELLKLRARNPEALIDLHDARVGTLYRPVTTGDVLLPPGMEAQVTSIVDPVILTFVIEETLSKMVPVKARITGRPEPGSIRFGAVTVEPDSVQVWGPLGLVEPIDSLLTEEIDLGGRSRTMRERVSILFDPDVEVETIEVTVQVPIENLERRVVWPVRILPFHPTFGLAWTTRPGSVRVVIEGPRSLLEKVEASDLEVHALLSPPILGEQERVPLETSLDSRLKPHVTVVTTEPATVGLVRRVH